MALQHARAGEIVDIAPLGSAIADWKTSAIIKTDQFEAIRLVVHAGVEIPQHNVAGSITLHCLEGLVELGLESAVLELRAHQWVYLDGGVPHSLRGIEESSLLLTIFFPRPTARSWQNATE